MPGEWYGGGLHLQPLVSDDGTPKTYSIDVQVGSDRHDISIVQRNAETKLIAGARAFCCGKMLTVVILKWALTRTNSQLARGVIFDWPVNFDNGKPQPIAVNGGLVHVSFERLRTCKGRDINNGHPTATAKSVSRNKPARHLSHGPLLPAAQRATPPAAIHTAGISSGFPSATAETRPRASKQVSVDRVRRPRRTLSRASCRRAARKVNWRGRSRPSSPAFVTTAAGVSPSL